MSIDVVYYSFSPSRADKKWENFIEDVTAMRKQRFSDKSRISEEEYYKNIQAGTQNGVTLSVTIRTLSVLG